MDYVNAATTGALLPHILPIMDLKKMLSHIEETLPPKLHLPVSSEDILHFYRYLCIHVLFTNKQFLLLKDIPIQDRSQQLSIYKIVTLDIPHGNFTAWYDINTQYLGMTWDETMVVEMSPHQFSICQEADGQFCNVITSFQPSVNPPSCITTLYTKNICSISARCLLQIRKTQEIGIPSQLAPNIWILTTPISTITTAATLICPEETSKSITIKKLIHILWLPPACSITLPNFHLPPHYKDSTLEVNISLDMPNLNTINISSLDFHIWKHLGKHKNESQLQHLASIPSIPVDQLYKHMVNGIQHITPFTSPEESTGDTDLIWTLFSHTGVYVMAIGLLIPAGLGIFCCYFFWCWPARLVCQPLQPGTTQYTIVGDDVEAAPIYGCDGKAPQLTRPHENHGMHMEWVPTQMESRYKQQMQSIVVPAQGSLVNTFKIQETQKCT